MNTIIEEGLTSALSAAQAVGDDSIERKHKDTSLLKSAKPLKIFDRKIRTHSFFLTFRF
jgi:hypothetical protein